MNDLSLRRQIDGTYLVPTNDIRALLRGLEPTEDPVRIGKTQYRRYTLRGVPAKHCDVIILAAMVDRLDNYGSLDPVVAVEAVIKFGKYDGADRRRFAVRRAPAETRGLPPDYRLRVIDGDAGDNQRGVEIANAHDVAIRELFPRLRDSLDGYNLSCVSGWHWKRYFTHLGDDEGMRELCDAWAAENQAQAANWTLAEANRSASRYLYETSVALGWRKLPLGARLRLFGPDGATMRQWQREETILAAIAEYHGRATGCGEATHRAAAAQGDFDGYSPTMARP